MNSFTWWPGQNKIIYSQILSWGGRESSQILQHSMLICSVAIAMWFPSVITTRKCQGYIGNFWTSSLSKIHLLSYFNRKHHASSIWQIKWLCDDILLHSFFAMVYCNSGAFTIVLSKINGIWELTAIEETTQRAIGGLEVAATVPMEQSSDGQWAAYGRRVGEFHDSRHIVDFMVRHVETMCVGESKERCGCSESRGPIRIALRVTIFRSTSCTESAHKTINHKYMLLLSLHFNASFNFPIWNPKSISTNLSHSSSNPS
jgi:hypothetical protein